MKKIAFLWHMHQPDYRDENNIITMPWVFLHAIKDYYDMPWLSSVRDEVVVTFNITPTLIDQLETYSRGFDGDRFVSLLMKDVDTLTTDERVYLNRFCRAANVDTMVKPLRGYAELFDRGELKGRELRDLEVFHLLSWCGTYLRMNNRTVMSLLNKGGSFSEDEKNELIRELVGFVSGIVPYYKQLYEEKKIGLSTTPYAHPILPLLINMGDAVVSNPSVEIPENWFPLEGDAKLHVDRAKEIFRDVFGVYPSGFWPAEGAVSEKTIKMLHGAGGVWCATDEAILFKTLGKDDRIALYHVYELNGMEIFFRDHVLSDKIGFIYRMWDWRRAVKDFVQYVNNVVPDGALVSCILDGENPWEFYHNNGFDFLNGLYEVLSEEFELVRFEDVSVQCRELGRIHPGSWIGGDFSTWVGHPEKNRAWEVLFDARRDYERHKSAVDDSSIMEHFLSAECSDWYWWYGEDHVTNFKIEFDSLFRKHLIAVYRAMGLNPPSSILMPIVRDKKTAIAISKPKFPISPRINGMFDSFFEWLGAGVIDEARWFSTMDTQNPIKRVYYGCDEKNVYIALEGDIDRIAGGRIVLVTKDGSYYLPISEQLVKVYPKGDVSIAVVSRDIVEMAIDKRLFDGEGRARIRMEIESGGEIVQILPGFGYLEIDMDEDYSKNWFV